MDAITAIATDHGLDVLNSALKNTATQYQLIGAKAHDATDDQLAVFYSAEIETSYYDDNGVLTFIIELPVAEDFGRYLYAVQVVDAVGQVVISASTPKIALASGIGGMLTLKAAISGEAGEVIFKASDYVTNSEMNDIWLPAFANSLDLSAYLTVDKANQHYAKLADFSNSLDRRGYQYLPNGLILQWGYRDVVSGSSINSDILFPIAFPNQCISASVFLTIATGNLDLNAFYRSNRQSYVASVPTPTGFDCQVFLESRTGDARRLEWMAIGH